MAFSNLQHDETNSHHDFSSNTPDFDKDITASAVNMNNLSKIDCNNLLVEESKTLKALYLNARSCNNKASEINELIIEKKVHVYISNANNESNEKYQQNIEADSEEVNQMSSSTAGKGIERNNEEDGQQNFKNFTAFD